jgi:membrane-associated phospholipid phosphatase
MRLAEWFFVAYFAYVAILSEFVHDRPSLHHQPFVYLVAWLAFFLLLNRCQRGRLRLFIANLRDWLPLAFTLIAFREMELFVPATYTLFFEKAWIRLDWLVLHDWHGRVAIESFGAIVPFYLEFCYLLVYGLAAFSLAWIVARHERKGVDYFWAVYLTGTLAAYALFPFFPSLPPRYAFPLAEPPEITTWVRTANLALLRMATIHSGVFPSAHVSSAFSCGWCFYFVFSKRRRWLAHGILIYAVSVSIATVYGRYHYVADVLAGFAISLIALVVAFAMRGYVQKHQSTETAGRDGHVR